MKRYLLTSLTLGAALSLGVAAEEKKGDKDKSLTTKTTETLGKAGEKTKEAGKSLAEGTKKAVEGVKDALTPDADAKKVEVKLTDKSVGISGKVEPGKTAFVVKNEGKEKHLFAVSGEEMDQRFFQPVAPGESKVLHMTLKPGHYRAFVPDKDEEKGKEKLSAHITVK
jgi:hypothetical protein